MKHYYEFSNEGMKKAIADRHTTLRRRHTLTILGVIALTVILLPTGGTVVAFTTL